MSLLLFHIIRKIKIRCSIAPHKMAHLKIPIFSDPGLAKINFHPAISDFGFQGFNHAVGIILACNKIIHFIIQ